MPKILESARRQLLDAARAQIERNGYARTTIRSVAAECGVAVGTVYNYFPSKDMLIATFMAEDWQESVVAMLSGSAADVKSRLRAIYSQLRLFVERHSALLSDTDAAKVYGAVLAQRHKQLRDQLAALIEPLCARDADPPFLAAFLAEALLTWTLEDAPFERIYRMIEKLI